MTEKEQTRLSKMLSLVLRHKPDTIELKLDENGWANTKDLLLKLNNHGFELTMDQLQTVVDNNDKKRFAFDESFGRIRASQGHSVEVDLALEERVPPVVLYHGTAVRNLDSIRATGLQKRERHHVHLSSNKDTAFKVGQRYGEPVLLEVQALAMHGQGMKFYLSANGVWLTDHVPAEFIKYPV